MKIVKKILPLIILSRIIGFNIPAFANESRIFDNAFLIRIPEFVESCNSTTGVGAVLIIREGRQLKSKDTISVITHAQGTLEATVTRILKGCNPFVEQDLALLHVPQKIEWLSDIDAMLAIRGKKLTKEKIGTVRKYSMGKKEPLFLNQIKKYIPEADHMTVDTALKFVLPGSKKEYIFIGVSHFDPVEYETAGDKVLKMKGFIFSINRGSPALLIEEDNLTNVFTVSNLNSKKTYEILVHSGSVYGGSYELRLFDGRTFLKDKIILFQWMD